MAIIQYRPPDEPENIQERDAWFLRRVDRLEKNGLEALGNPESVVDDVQELLNAKGGLSVIGGLKALRRVVKRVKKIQENVASTAAKIQQLRNADALKALILDTAITEMAELSSQTDFASADDAIAVRDEVSGLLEERAIASGDDKTYLQFMKLRASVIDDLTNRSANLSRVKETQPHGFTSSLLLAHNLYGDASREEEVVERNNLLTPGFISPQAPLKVLNA